MGIRTHEQCRGALCHSSHRHLLTVLPPSDLLPATLRTASSTPCPLNRLTHVDQLLASAPDIMVYAESIWALTYGFVSR